jgi:hypothetical protein
VQPLLLPKQTAVADYVAGSASLFTGDFAHDRKFLEHAVDKVLVYESGALVVQFKQQSLFEPVRFATLGEPSKADIAAQRLESQAELREQKAEVVRLSRRPSRPEPRRGCAPRRGGEAGLRDVHPWISTTDLRSG